MAGVDDMFLGSTTKGTPTLCRGGFLDKDDFVAEAREEDRRGGLKKTGICLIVRARPAKRTTRQYGIERR